MLDAIRSGFKAARKWMGDAFSRAGFNTPTLRDMDLDADEWVVKQKLGHSFFTRRLSRNSRVARIASLTRGEYELARQRGWV